MTLAPLNETSPAVQFDSLEMRNFAGAELRKTAKFRQITILSYMWRMIFSIRQIVVEKLEANR